MNAVIVQIGNRFGNAMGACQEQSFRRNTHCGAGFFLGKDERGIDGGRVLSEVSRYLDIIFAQKILLAKQKLMILASQVRNRRGGNSDEVFQREPACRSTHA
jgi:hypothetical protein